MLVTEEVIVSNPTSSNTKLNRRVNTTSIWNHRHIRADWKYQPRREIACTVFQRCWTVEFKEEMIKKENSKYSMCQQTQESCTNIGAISTTESCRCTDWSLIRKGTRHISKRSCPPHCIVNIGLPRLRAPPYPGSPL